MTIDSTIANMRMPGMTLTIIIHACVVIVAMKPGFNSGLDFEFWNLDWTGSILFSFPTGYPDANKYPHS